MSTLVFLERRGRPGSAAAKLFPDWIQVRKGFKSEAEAEERIIELQSKCHDWEHRVARVEISKVHVSKHAADRYIERFESGIPNGRAVEDIRRVVLMKPPLREGHYEVSDGELLLACLCSGKDVMVKTVLYSSGIARASSRPAS